MGGEEEGSKCEYGIVAITLALPNDFWTEEDKMVASNK
jgi:hypothetical protein